MDITTLIGFFAAVCTSVSYFPQLKKCWDTGKAENLSLLMFSILATGVATWVVYGVFKGDIVIVISNAVSFCCLAGILGFKLREKATTVRALKGWKSSEPAGQTPERTGVQRLFPTKTKDAQSG